MSYLTCLIIYDSLSCVSVYPEMAESIISPQTRSIPISFVSDYNGDVDGGSGLRVVVIVTGTTIYDKKCKAEM